MINGVPLTSLNLNMQNSIRDNALIAYDATTDTLFDSGLFVPIDGEVEAAAGTVSVGVQDMSSAGDEVVWVNRNDAQCYAAPWYNVDEVSTGVPLARTYGPFVDIVRESEDITEVTDPSFDVVDGVLRLVTRMTFNFPVAQENMVFEVIVNGFSMWRMVTDVSAGLQEIRLKVPVTFLASPNVFKIYRLDGQPARLMGNPATQKPYYKVRYRPISEHELLFDASLTSRVVSIVAPVSYVGPAETVTDATWGTIGVTKDTREIIAEFNTGNVVVQSPVVGPSPYQLVQEGTMVKVINSSSGPITLSARFPETFEGGATASVIAPHTYRTFVKRIGNVWHLLESSTYDSNLRYELDLVKSNLVTITDLGTQLSTAVVPFFHEQTAGPTEPPDSIWGTSLHYDYTLKITSIAGGVDVVVKTPIAGTQLALSGTKLLVINKDTTHNLLLTPRSGETIDGSTNALMITHGTSMQLIKSGTNWVSL